MAAVPLHHTSDAEADDLFRVCHGSYQLLPGIRSGYADDKGRVKLDDIVAYFRS